MDTALKLVAAATSVILTAVYCWWVWRMHATELTAWWRATAAGWTERQDELARLRRMWEIGYA